MNNIYISSCDKNGGIYRFTLENGKLKLLDKTALAYPMYTVIHGNRFHVICEKTYAETDFGSLVSYLFAGDNGLENPPEPVSSNGVCPCHLCVTDTDTYMTNYVSGSISTKSGKILTHRGKGINLPRQDKAHTHYINVSPDGKYLLSCDLGLDAVYTYNFDLSEKSVAYAPKGHGPRHLVYSPDGKYVYCANELGSTVSVFEYNDGILTLKNTYGCIASECENTVAAIRFYDGHVFVSNRGEDTIVCFKADGETLTFVSRTSVEGCFPRDFDFCEEHIICTNEHTNSVTVFKYENGTLTLTDTVENIADPLCVTVLS